jgi:hypothetical protein
MARARGERFKVRVGADRAIVRVGAETPVAHCSLPISLHRASPCTVLALYYPGRRLWYNICSSVASTGATWLHLVSEWHSESVLTYMHRRGCMNGCRGHEDNEQKLTASDASHMRFETSQEACLKRPLPRPGRHPFLDMAAWHDARLLRGVPCARYTCIQLNPHVMMHVNKQPFVESGNQGSLPGDKHSPDLQPTVLKIACLTLLGKGIFCCHPNSLQYTAIC